MAKMEVQISYTDVAPVRALLDVLVEHAESLPIEVLDALRALDDIINDED
ncbi:hypothetical protein [Methylophaga sp.]